MHSSSLPTAGAFITYIAIWPPIVFRLRSCMLVAANVIPSRDEKRATRVWPAFSFPHSQNHFISKLLWKWKESSQLPSKCGALQAYTHFVEPRSRTTVLHHFLTATWWLVHGCCGHTVAHVWPRSGKQEWTGNVSRTCSGATQQLTVNRMVSGSPSWSSHVALNISLCQNILMFQIIGGA